jgi:hypothetical protein
MLLQQQIAIVVSVMLVVTELFTRMRALVMYVVTHLQVVRELPHVEDL